MPLLARQFEQFGRNSPDIALRRIDRLTGVYDVHGTPGVRGLFQKSFAQPPPVFKALAFHSIEWAVQPTCGALRRHVEQENTIGQDTARRNQADLSHRFGVEAARVALVDNIGKQKSIGDYRLARCQCRADDLVDQLGPGRHVQQHFAAPTDRCRCITRQQQLANSLAELRAAGIAANDHIVSAPAERVAEQADLRRFSHAINAIEREKHGVL